MSLILSLALLPIVASQASSGDQAWEPQSWFGWSSCWVGDVDGDSRVDLATSDLTYQEPGEEGGSGIVAILSGSDGALVKVLRRQAGDQAFGRRLAAIGPGDGGNGIGLAVSGVRHPGSGAARGFVRIISVRTGETLVELEEGDGGESFGEVLATGRDVDRDGALDYAVGAPSWSAAGRCYLYSAKEHKLLQKWECGEAGTRGVGAIALIGDLDGDGCADVAVGSPGLPQHEKNLSSVAVLSGATGRRIMLICEPKRVRAFGSAIADLGDVNGDGRGDLAVGAPAGLTLPRWKEYPRHDINEHSFGWWFPTDLPWGAVYVCSGSDGSILGTARNEGPIRKSAPTGQGFVGDDFGGELACFEASKGHARVLLIADQASPQGGAVHCFEVPEMLHRWSRDAVMDARDRVIGYRLYGDLAQSQDRVILATSCSWFGEHPRLRALAAFDGEEVFCASATAVLPRSE